MSHSAERPRAGGDKVPGSMLRNHNERLILSLLRESGPLSGAQIARECAFSAQTASVITRSLEADGLIAFGDPVKGKVGKPSVPVALSAEGAYAFGLRIGRRGVEIILLDLLGQIRGSERSEYDFPTPEKVDQFVEGAIGRLSQRIPAARRDRIVGIGVGAPFELWNWLDLVGAPIREMAAWEGHSFHEAFARFTDLPVLVGNDATMACNGERVAGIGRHKPNFAYIYIGPLLGGGIVLNGELFEGASGNAAALGSLPAGGAGAGQINRYGSILLLERHLAEQTGKRVSLWGNAAAWAEHAELIEPWIRATALALAQAAVTVSSILDLQDIVIDGSYPRDVAQRIASDTQAALTEFDTRGIHPPSILCGTLGARAGTLGAAHQPIMAAHFLDGSQIAAR
ncbi:hypothetical protein ATO11_13365 [Pseudaestuariivita atlantica]|uniref:ROK family transcriptional regulator n=2 Tax=Pseudaestuariivita atlantica TaxID=1317121 RepID=A0A0L1JNW8_9RHOB|nr:hypothetical protein ATO11_13365 [Pseudaestuariivita atlantica]